MNTATFIANNQNMRSDARLYKMVPPYQGHEYVIVSAIETRSTIETFIFPAYSDGKVSSWNELDGSFDGKMDHVQALGNAGYIVSG